MPRARLLEGLGDRAVDELGALGVLRSGLLGDWWVLLDGRCVGAGVPKGGFGAVGQTLGGAPKRVAGIWRVASESNPLQLRSKSRLERAENTRER